MLVHELVHTLLPPEAKHGKEFKAAALRVGLEGQMRLTQPGPILNERLHALTASLGPFPHAKLNYSAPSDAPKKQTTRWLKAECGAACGYTIRLASKWAKIGLPKCPANQNHGTLICDVKNNVDDHEFVTQDS